MMKCHPMAYERCPHHKYCDSMETAFFTEGSVCDQFNQRILSRAVTLDVTVKDLFEEMTRPSPMTMADKIRAMSDEDLTDMIYDLNMEGTFCTNRKECEELLNNDGITDEMCKKCLLEYLRKPVEDKPTLPSGIYLDKEESGLTEEG